MLPHVVQNEATTFDLMVYDVVNTWENYKINKSQGKLAEPSQEALQEMMKKVRK
jgi:hypothetical protein